jgi:hypothetical protein
MFEGIARPAGKLGLRVIKAQCAPLSWRIRNSLRWNFVWGWIAWHVAPILAKVFGFSTVTSRLFLRVHKATGEWIDYGVAGYRMVTTVGVTAMSTSFQTPGSPGNFFYHAIGHTNTAENVADTTLAAEETTAYNPDGTRATGTHVAGGSANIYRSVGTNTVDGSVSCVEHGIFTQATVGGSLLDRTVFATVTLGAGDGLQSTYEITFTAGG